MGKRVCIPSHKKIQNYLNFIYWCEPKMVFDWLPAEFTHPLLFSVMKDMQLEFVLWMSIYAPPPHPPTPLPARKKRKWVTFKSLFMCRSIPPLPWKILNQFTIHIVKWLGPWPPANKVIHWIPLPLENVTLDWNSAVEYEIISHRHAPDIEYSYNHNIPQTL